MVWGSLFLILSLWGTVPLSTCLLLATLDLFRECTATIHARINCWVKWGLYNKLGQHRHLWLLQSLQGNKSFILLHWQNCEPSMNNVSKSALIYNLALWTEYRLTIQHEYQRSNPEFFLNKMETLWGHGVSIIYHVTLNNVIVCSW